jgi:hypothetical protein
MTARRELVRAGGWVRGFVHNPRGRRPRTRTRSGIAPTAEATILISPNGLSVIAVDEPPEEIIGSRTHKVEVVRKRDARQGTASIGEDDPLRLCLVAEGPTSNPEPPQSVHPRAREYRNMRRVFGRPSGNSRFRRARSPTPQGLNPGFQLRGHHLERALDAHHSLEVSRETKPPQNELRSVPNYDA